MESQSSTSDSIPGSFDLSFSDASSAQSLDGSESEEVEMLARDKETLLSMKSSTNRSSKGNIIGATDITELMSCPCCKQSFDQLDIKSTLNEPLRQYPWNNSVFRQFMARQRGSLFNVGDDDEDSNGDEDEDRDILPGVLEEGVKYYPKRILAEGWVHKKGTGTDWISSRAWKARWARLCLAQVDGYGEADVPLLLIYWFPSSENASTVIVLVDTVVLAIDKHDLVEKDLWKAHRFEVRHVVKEGSEDTPVARTFAAPKKGRDAWVYEISQALLSYAKQKDLAKKIASFQASEAMQYMQCSPTRQFNSTLSETWVADRFVNLELRGPSSPPSSPVMPRPGNISNAGGPGLPRPSRPTSPLTKEYPIEK
jgi:hypothetical protein